MPGSRRHDGPSSGRTERRTQPKGAHMPVVTRRELLEAGGHFGHQTRRGNPKMQRYLFGGRSGVYIIDLERTLSGLEKAHALVPAPGRRRRIVLVIRAEKQGQE